MIQIKYMSKTLSDFRNFLKPSTKKVLFSISKALNEINEIIGKQVFYSNINMNFNYKNKNEELIKQPNWFKPEKNSEIYIKGSSEYFWNPKTKILFIHEIQL